MLLSFYKTTPTKSVLFLLSRKISSSFLTELESILGFSIKRKLVIYERALTAKSINNALEYNNERLEFLGDSVLSLIVTDFLFKKYPYKDESFLTDMRSKIVCRESLNVIAKRMGIDTIILRLLESHRVKRDSDDCFGNCLEAIIGALYIDKGFEFTYAWIEKRILQEMVQWIKIEEQDANARNKLHSWVAAQGKELIFNMDKVESLNGLKKFHISVLIDQNVVSTASGFTKKEAINEAAKLAIKKLPI